MAMYAVPSGTSRPAGVRLRPNAVAVPALVSHLRPALVVPQRESGVLLAAVTAADASRGGRMCGSAIGVQLWDRPFDAVGGPGSATHLGSVDWTVDAPAKGYVSLTRAMVTAAGAAAGTSPAAVLATVLALAELSVDTARLGPPAAPPADPFRRRAEAAPTLLAD